MLSKNYTLEKVKSLIRDLANEVAPDKVQPQTLTEIIGKNLLDICEMLNGATQPDYESTTILGDSTTFYSTSVVSGGTYTNSTKTVTMSSHGLTTNDIGKRIILFDRVSFTRAGVTSIASIISTNAFTVTNAMGGDIGSLGYAVLSAQSTTSLDLSSLKIDKVVKLVDSVNGLVSPRKAFDFENLKGISHFSNSVFYYQGGETLYLWKGNNVLNWGTLTLHYYRLPNLPVNDSDYIDLKDKYIPLLIDKCKIEVYELGQQTPPNALSSNVDQRTQAIRQLNVEKETSLKQKQK